MAQSHSITFNKNEVGKYGDTSIIETNLEELRQYKITKDSFATPKGEELGRLAVEVTKYCTSCHLPYLAGETTRKFSFAHQNFSDLDNWNCLKCHVSHQSIIKRDY